jgi:hypothetical protein
MDIGPPPVALIVTFEQQQTSTLLSSPDLCDRLQEALRGLQIQATYIAPITKCFGEPK